MPAGDVFGLDGFFLNKSNPITVSTIGINSTGVGAGITVVSGVLNATAGIATLTFSTAAGLSTTPFYVGAKIAVSGIGSTTGIAFTGYNGTFNVTGFAGTTTVSYATTGYVGSVTAGITTTGLVMLVTDTQVTNTTWSSSQTHGWFGGGINPSIAIYSIVDRIDFSNDTGTANIRGPLSLARYRLAATGNSNYGWFGGGSPGPVSRVERIDFSNDSSTTSPRGPLSLERDRLAATGNSNYGWFGGGSPGPVSTVDRIDFSNDSGTASVRGPLSLARNAPTATANSNYAWFGGGFTVTTVDRIDFSNDASTASPRGPLSLARGAMGATGNSNYGWFGGGNTGTPVFSIVDRIDFSNDSATASPRGPLSSARYFLGATGNSNYGWFGGGTINPGAAVASTVDRIDFSNDSVTASTRGPLSASRGYAASATSGQARSSSVRLQKAGNYGWFGGGGTPRVSTVYRIDFSNDSTSASPRGLLSSARYSLSATGNSNYGWFGGGETATARVSTVDRIDFANDSATVSIRGPLIQARQWLAATGNSNYGWFGGGGNSPSDRSSPYYSIVDRINFSNDSTTASVRGPLNFPERYSLAATGNSNYGWFCGGASFNSKSAAGLNITDRINFANDSVTASPRSPLSSGRHGLAATGNTNYGWFGGGVNNGPLLASVERMNFSNDLSSTLPRGALSQPIYVLAATGNSNYGWFGGGNIGPAPLSGTTITNVYRINFSNDSVTTVERGGLSLDRERLAATSNTHIG